MINLIDGSNMLHRAMYDTAGKVGVHPLRDLYIRFMSTNRETYVVWDGAYSNARRRCIYPGYKSNRPEKAEDIKASFDIMKEILIHCPVTQIEIPSWEADDVIYTMAKEYLGEGKEVRIETNDSDFWQLGVHPNCQLPMIKSIDCEPRHTRLNKALLGDKADAIPGWRGFGPKKWEAMANHYDEMQLIIELEDYDAWATLPWPKGLVPDYGSFYDVCTYFKVVTMQEVPANEFLGNIVIGVQNYARAEEIFAKWKI